MMYHAYDAQVGLWWPLRTAARWAAPGLLEPQDNSWLGDTRRSLGAACRVLGLAEVTHHRPDWGIHTVPVGDGVQPVTESAALETPFATLRRFARATGSTGTGTGAVEDPALPRVLLVAPMSGHFATLLRDTVQTLLRDHEVYITDWHNVRDVPLAAGAFGLDEYTEHLMLFLRHLGPGAHMVAVCQPCVSALAATALMAEDDDPAAPASLTLMAGPIDCRISPTVVNQLANDKPIAWFERHLISTVPWGHRGAGRRVYPGFLQLTAFMSMNRERHASAFRDYYQHLLAGNTDKAETTRRFYEEYMAVSDLSADFYLQTVERVFQTYDLARGELLYRGRRVNPAAIRRTALLTVEGERDDICSVGQTLAAQDLCSSLRPWQRTHYVQPGVGHYGVFSGRRWQNSVYPVLRNVVQLSR